MSCDAGATGASTQRKPELEMHERIENAIKLAGRGEEQEAEQQLEALANRFMMRRRLLRLASA